jgi:hypothetical protein
MGAALAFALRQLIRIDCGVCLGNAQLQPKRGKKRTFSSRHVKSLLKIFDLPVPYVNTAK